MEGQHGIDQISVHLMERACHHDSFRIDSDSAGQWKRRQHC